MKNSESIKRALDTQKRSEELKNTRLQAIDNKIRNKDPLMEVEVKSVQEQAYLKVTLNQPKATQDGSIELAHDQYASNEDIINRLAKSKSNSVLGVKHRKNSPQQNISIAQISETKRKQLEQKAMLVALSPRELGNPAATPVRDRLTMIKSIYETNVLRDPVFLGTKNKLSQLRNLKEHHSG